MSTTMTTEAIITLTQWFSPAYPVGAFAYSHGLEAACADGQIGDAETLATWIHDILQHGGGRADAIFLAASYHAANLEAVQRLDAECRAFAPTAERLQETDLQGAAFAKATSDVWGGDLPRLTYPVAVGWAAKSQDLPHDLTATLYLQAFAANLAAAGQRLVAVGQTEAQRIVKALAPLYAGIAEETASGDLSQLSSTAFMADIASMRHETQYSRMFRT